MNDDFWTMDFRRWNFKGRYHGVEVSSKTKWEGSLQDMASEKKPCSFILELNAHILLIFPFQRGNSQILRIKSSNCLQLYIYIQRYTMIWIRSSKYLQFQAPMFATHQVRNNFMVSPPTATTASFQGPQPAARSTADTTGNRGRNGVSLVTAGGFVEMSPHGWLISRGTTPLPIFRPVHQAVGHDENLPRFEDHEISGCRTMDSCGLVCCVSKLGTSVHFIWKHRGLFPAKKKQNMWVWEPDLYNSGHGRGYMLPLVT